jgi:hypothetical protein
VQKYCRSCISFDTLPTWLHAQQQQVEINETEQFYGQSRAMHAMVEKYLHNDEQCGFSPLLSAP